MSRYPLPAILVLAGMILFGMMIATESRPAAESRVTDSRTPGVAATPFAQAAKPKAETAARPASPGEALRPARKHEDSAIESSFTREQLLELQAQAMLLPVSAGISRPDVATGVTFSLGTNFDSIDITECCETGTLNPPDPELAVGPNHIIAVVNNSLEIYDKAGATLVGPMGFETFFASIPGPCTAFPFDPNVLYDESADRFIVAVDGDGESYCVGVTQTGDPTGGYFFYDFTTNVGGQFFDYPHAGVGVDAIYVGANMFGGGSGRLFAFEKSPMYTGSPAASATRDLGSNGTPQPMNIHLPFPTSGPHYILTSRNGTSNPSNFGLFSWDDPFGADVLVDLTTINTTAVHGVVVGFPVSNPQQGGGNITGFNPRPLDFEYRNGSGWFTNMVSCNPGGGTINCIQWAQVDVGTATAVDAGVFADDVRFRYMPDLAVNACDDMMVGFTTSDSTSFPGVTVAGRESGDPAGTLQGELDVKAGETTMGDTSRWGDYTGMTIDPDGTTFWYLGEYAKNNGDGRNWGTYIGALSFADCASDQIFADGFESGDTAAWSSTEP